MNFIIIAATAIISITAFSNYAFIEQLKHWPYAEQRRNEYFRWVTGGLLHADWGHLLFNMLTLYFFGGQVEAWFLAFFGPNFGGLAYLGFYLLAIAAASAATFFRHKDNPSFSSIGASGAVAAVLFAAILLNPTMGIYIMFIPIPIPGFLFGPMYLWYSSDSARRGQDNIDHIAHFYGAVFGFFFPLLFSPGLLLQFLGEMVFWITNLFS
jgi:membrane associated rhomboid family serine protease